MNRCFVIDFTAFTGRDKTVIVKELSIADVDSQCVQHYVFRPPKDTETVTWDPFMGRQYQWMSMHYHGLDYFEGTSDYANMESTVRSVCNEADFIFAPSQEKAAWLEKNVFDKSRVVINLELLGCEPQLPTSVLTFPTEDNVHQCLLHHLRAPGFYCTQSSVKKLASWCWANKAKLDLNQADNRVKSFHGWTLIRPTPQELAAEGFVKFAGRDDMTRCVYCGVDLHQWVEGDEPAKDHEKYSPFCHIVFEATNNSNKQRLQCDCGRCLKPTEDRERARA